MKIQITKKGDTIEKIANKFAISIQDLIDFNPHINLTVDLTPGIKLIIPPTKGVDSQIKRSYSNLDTEYEKWIVH